MSMALSALGRILLVSRACAVELSVCTGIQGCGWPSSLTVCRMDTAVFALMKSAPSLASAADDITARIICEILRMVPLFFGMSLLLAMNIWPPARLRAFAFER